MAAARAYEAQIRYGNVGAAEQDRQQLLERKRLLDQQIGHLDVRSSLAGTVMSVRPANLTGSRLIAGTEIAEVADVSTLQARLYVADSEMRDVRVGQMVRLRPDSAFSSMNGIVAGIAPASSQMEGGLAPRPAYKGLAPPQYYVLTVSVPNAGDLRYGMTGNAKIEVRRTSLAGLAWKRARDFVARKLW
jgi:multidrug resistance efflux pump